MAAGKVDVSRRVGVSTLSKRFCDPIVEESLIERKFRIRDGFGQDGYVVGTEKPEEGELLDERGTWYVNDEDNVARPQKRRKFSPILWDREDKSPSMQKELSGYVLGFAAGRADTWPNGSKHEVDESPGYVHSSLTQQTYSDDDREPGRMIEEDFSLVPNISTSRWAYDDELDKDGCNEENDNMSREKVLKSGSPGSGVTQRGNSGGSLYGSSGSDVGCYPLFEGGEHGSGSELDNDGRMEVDERSDDSVADPSDLDSDDDSEPVLPKPSGRNMLLACRSVFEYEKLGKISEGSYGIVYKARDKKTGEMVALKKLKMGREREGFPLYYLREINALLSFNHPSVVNVREVVADDSFDGFDSIYIVMEYVDNDLKSLMQARRQPFSPNEVKCLLLQLLDGVKYLHDNWLLHRDLKTSNLLLNNKGELKICDFGMARQYGSPLNQFTQLVVTLWYRAPELLLGTKEYSTAVDMWSVGCIMAELLTNKPLFDGKTEVDQLDKIFKTLGTPNEKIWPGYSQLPGLKVNFSQQPYNTLRSKFPRTLFMASPVLSDLGFDLLSKLLTYDPAKRITAEDALNHPWFHEVPLPSSKDFMPTFPPQYSQMR